MGAALKCYSCAIRLIEYLTELQDPMLKSPRELPFNSPPDKLREFIASFPGMACQIELKKNGVLTLPYVSEGCLALLGITPLKIEMCPELLFSMLHPDDRDAFYQSMHASALNLTPWNWEGRFLLPPSNELKWVNLRATPYKADSLITVWQGFMVNITQNVLAKIEIDESRQRLRELSSHIESIKEEERMRIAREIHDEIGVLLTALKMDLSWMTKHFPEDSRELLEKSQDMSNLLDTASAAANDLVHSLRPAFLDCFGIVAAIEIEAKEFTKRTSVPCRITTSNDSIEFSNEQSITLFRVFQETLNNIMKHANASQVSVEILNTDGRIFLIVTDDGIGFDDKSRNKTRSFGLRGIQERIGHIGGTTKISSQLGKGTRVAVSFPLHLSEMNISDAQPNNLFPEQSTQ